MGLLWSVYKIGTSMLNTFINNNVNYCKFLIKSEEISAQNREKPVSQILKSHF